MSIRGNRSVTIEMTGDVEYGQEFEAIENGSSPGENEVIALASGANTITAPTGATGVTIVPPSTNTATLTLKGVSGDTGISLALTSPTSLGLNSVSSFVLTASAAVTVRFIWT